MEKSFGLGFPASNNEVEYEALLAGLKISRQVGIDRGVSSKLRTKE